jgi:DNA polymerase I
LRSMKKPYVKGYKLLHEGALCFAEMEEHGIRVDVPYCEKTLKRLQCLKKREMKKLQESEIGAVWQKTYGEATNWGSNQQLAHVLFEQMGYKTEHFTAKGSYSTSEEALSEVSDPAVSSFARMKRYEKAGSTYIRNFLNLQTDGFLHPFFNLHLVQTYRSSCDSPNFQNIPARDPEISKMIRRAIIPRPGRRLVDLDISGAEVRAAACYHRDPRMIEYICDSTKDMHRDMAAQIYCLQPSEVTKKIRYMAKNKFVFPEFYGSYYLHCAKHLWEGVDLELDDGRSVRDVLKANGISCLGACRKEEKPVHGTFEHHLKQVEDDFWEDRFQQYAQWKEEWYAKYLQRGFILLRTGFVCRAHMQKNQAINYAIQGTAFHWLLRALIELNRQIKLRHMKTLLIGQIHDSIVADVPEQELNDFLELAHYVMCVWLRKIWKWIVVPLEIEAEASEVDGNWFEKKGVLIPQTEAFSYDEAD